jgi:hypothetical protein
MGWLWRQAEAHLYGGNNLQQGSRSIHRRSHNKGICECGKKLWDSNKEVSIRHERVEGVREGLTVGQLA